MDCATVADKRKFVSNIYYIRDYAVTPGDGIPTLMRSQFDLRRRARSQHQPAWRWSKASRVSASSSASTTSARPAAPSTTAAAIDWQDPETRTTPTNRGDGVPDGDFVRCTTATPCTVAQLMNVTSVKIYVLARSREASPSYTDTKTYTLGAPAPSAHSTTTSSATSSPRPCACPTSRARQDDAMNACNRRIETGATLVVGLIMLTLITLMLMAALTIGTANFRAVTNMQFRDEAIAAANRAIEQVISSPFATRPAARETIDVDLDNDGTTDYDVDIAEPQCVRATHRGRPPPPSSISLPPTMGAASTWNTVWDIRATVTRRQRRRRCSGRARGRARAAEPKHRKTSYAHENSEIIRSNST